MPTISRFYGIDITMRYRGEHPPPHFHAEYAGYKASFDIGTLTMKGSMPPKARGLIVEWAAIHEAEFVRGLAKGGSGPTFDRD
jgi:hypothetical protein